MVLPLIGGVLIDKIGINISILIFSLILVIGQGVFAISGFMGTEDQSNNSAFYVAITGRFIYGLGAESLTVCQTTVMSRWFIGKELSLALGLNMSIGRLGSVFNSYSLPPLANATSLGYALLFGLTLCIISMICGIVLIVMDKLIKSSDNSKDLELHEEPFHFKDLKDFSLSFWLITFNWIFIYMGFNWYNNISNDFFVKRYGFTQTEAGRITSNTFLVTVLLAPLFGTIADRIGHKVTFWIISSSILVVCHSLYLTIPSSTSEEKSYFGLIPINLVKIKLVIKNECFKWDWTCIIVPSEVLY